MDENEKWEMKMKTGMVTEDRGEGAVRRWSQ